MLGLFEILALFLHLAIASAAQSFAGTNLYYAAGLTPSTRKTYLEALRSANIKVLRVWLDGQTSASTKNTPITSFPSLEPNSIGAYNDKVLNLLDDFMVDAHSHGIKLLISLHSWNALKSGDVYARAYGRSGFYTNAAAAAAFDRRIRHVLAHRHRTLGKPWSQLSGYVFAFEAQNEAMIGLPDATRFIREHTRWQCDRARTIRTALGGSNIAVTTGGASWLDQSLPDGLFRCAEIDVLAIHAYGPGDYSVSKLQSYVAKARQNNKMLMMQEWGACYYASENNNCPRAAPLGSAQRNANIQRWADAISRAGIPWLYWQIIPNRDPHYGYDFEVGITQDASWGTLAGVARRAGSYWSPFEFGQFLKL